MKKNEKMIMQIMNDVENKGYLLEFKILSMKDLANAKELFQYRWNKRTSTEKMEILLLLDSSVTEYSISLLSETQKNILAMLLILRIKEADYLPQ